MTHLKKGETDKALACLTVVIGRYHNKMSDKERKTYEYALNNAGAIAMLAGLVVVPIVSAFTPKMDKAFVDDLFESYDVPVTVHRKDVLEEDTEEE